MYGVAGKRVRNTLASWCHQSITQEKDEIGLAHSLSMMVRGNT